MSLTPSVPPASPLAAGVRFEGCHRRAQLLLALQGEAEKLIRDQSTALDWTIFQPSVMFGPGDSFLNRLAGLLAAIPLVFPLARPNARLQPVSVDDVVNAMLPCLHGGASTVKLMNSADLGSTPCAKLSAWWRN